jgi:hypothetical protein
VLVQLLVLLKQIVSASERHFQVTFSYCSPIDQFPKWSTKDNVAFNQFHFNYKAYGCRDKYDCSMSTSCCVDQLNAQHKAGDLNLLKLNLLECFSIEICKVWLSNLKEFISARAILDALKPTWMVPRGGIESFSESITLLGFIRFLGFINQQIRRLRAGIPGSLQTRGRLWNYLQFEDGFVIPDF